MICATSFRQSFLTLQRKLSSVSAMSAIRSPSRTLCPVLTVFSMRLLWSRFRLASSSRCRLFGSILLVRIMFFTLLSKQVSSVLSACPRARRSIRSTLWPSPKMEHGIYANARIAADNRDDLNYDKFARYTSWQMCPTPATIPRV